MLSTATKVAGTDGVGPSQQSFVGIASQDITAGIGKIGIEPISSVLSRLRSTKLSYIPAAGFLPTDEIWTHIVSKF